jgi:hypothetical protein
MKHLSKILLLLWLAFSQGESLGVWHPWKKDCGSEVAKIVRAEWRDLVPEEQTKLHVAATQGLQTIASDLMASGESPLELAWEINNGSAAEIQDLVNALGPTPTKQSYAFVIRGVKAIDHLRKSAEAEWHRRHNGSLRLWLAHTVLGASVGSMIATATFLGLELPPSYSPEFGRLVSEYIGSLPERLDLETKVILMMTVAGGISARLICRILEKRVHFLEDIRWLLSDQFLWEDTHVGKLCDGLSQRYGVTSCMQFAVSGQRYLICLEPRAEGNERDLYFASVPSSVAPKP